MTARRPPATWYAVDTKSSGRGLGLAQLTPPRGWQELREWADANVGRPGPVVDWPRFGFRLAKGGFAHLQPINSPFWLFSTELRNLVVELSPATPVEWLPLDVASEDGTEERTYWTPSLLEEMDVYLDGCVNRDKTGAVIHGYLDHTKADRYRFLAINHGDGRPALYAHRELKKQAAAQELDETVKWDTEPSVSWQRDPSSWNQTRRD